MKEVNLDEIFDIDSLVNEIVSTIQNGGLVLMPSDTCYGFVADPWNPIGKEKLYAVKDMPVEKPSSLSCADKAMFAEYADLDEVGLELMEIYLPGPLTLVVNSKDKEGLVGLRLPRHDLMNLVAKELGHPFFTTSANKHGKETPYGLEQVKEQLGSAYSDIDLVINAGVLDYKAPSTVVKVEENQLEFLREGDLAETLRLNYSVKT